MIKDYSKTATSESVETAKQALENNGFTVEVVDSLAEAKAFVLGQIPEGSDVFTSSSVTLDESGLTEELNSEKYESARDKFMSLAQDPETRLQARQIGSASDYAVSSVHAITEDGQVLMASNSGSQMPNSIFGANHVFWVVGTQKIVRDLNEAFDRLENHTFPLEDKRAQQAYGVNSIMSKILVFRKDPPQRITIVLINEPVGY